MAQKQIGGNMKIGDLVHSPVYPYWGIGMVVGKATTEVLIRWFGCNELRSLGEDWHDIDDLEVI